MSLSSVSVIIPCRNEEKFIGKCLDSILEQDYSKEHLEILVVDGMSNDGTRSIIKTYQNKYPLVKLIDNPRRITSTALNIGIEQANGKIIMRMDAHTIYDKEYINKCIQYLEKYQADNVGGIWKIKPQQNTIMGLSIALSLGHIIGGGNAYYKTGWLSKPKEVDTVPFGCYKKEIFKKIGLFNENLKRSQDMEFNLRLKRAGGKIMLFPDIISYYYARSALKEFIQHNFSNGVWATYPLKFIKITLSLRHYIPAIFVSGLIIGAPLTYFIPIIMPLYLTVIGLYLFLTLTAALQIAFKKRNPLYLFTMPLIFATLHLSYGIGSIFGLIKLLIPESAEEKTNNKP